MLHRKLYAFLLVFALLLAQVGAVRHYAEHLSDVGKSSQKQDADEKYSSLCEKCIQYDLLGQGLGAPPAKIFVAPSGHQAFNQPYRSIILRLARLYTARAPPSLV